MPPSPPPRDQRFATTLAHGLQVLRCWGPQDGALANVEIANRTGLSKATISRLTDTLSLIGFLRFDSELRRYRLAPATLSAGHPLLAHLPVRQLARAAMQSLADEVHGTVSLGVRDRATMVYVETTRTHVPSDFLPDIGAALPLVTTAIGRAWLAACPDADREDAHARVRAERAPGWRGFRRAAEQARSEVAARGFCTSPGDFQPDVHAVAAPLAPTVDGELIVLNCGVPAVLAAGGLLDRRVGPRLVAIAAEVREALRELP